ncbi:chromosome segregation protein SMC [Thiohalobacter thiocyanaticus]|uniref:Chromosome partition protein Smc n=1 Tax=Thiohalobacter thiocyanaticus TaxID=585455 RepID=A0A426QFX9_9GAMM|nr:chromosome segregation protein SMC [Thiohalobacter thiocyanaticus]RRQ20658.1 chromosome segregation protein SMC [Thiohalobacter thiocyanaticus]
MRLTKIKLAGFKSFVDPTTIHIPTNLVGIVGPNGCGKSNTIDAVRWVMGESSAKHLRGDSMADVIFNGSNARKPVGHASVELIFDNSEGKVTGQYAHYNEISIKRQVSRDGQSSYYLNGTRCRRRDITDIFLGTGLGPRSYSIIEQGMISRLIEAKPEELRIYLEEAAGISKYKERRRETENRIRHTHENLDRLNDLRDEIEKYLEKLQRQARTAERYKELKQQERRLRAELLTLKYSALHQDFATKERAIKEQETALEGVVAEQRAIETEIEKSRESLVEANETFNEVQGRYYGLGAEIARLEQAIQHSKESRQRQQEELRKAEQAWNEVEAHISVDGKRLQELDGELTEKQPVLEQLQGRAEASREALQQAEQTMQQWQNEWEAFNQRAAEPQQTAQVERARIDQLERQLAQYEQRLTRIEEEKNRLDDSQLQQEIDTLSNQEAERARAVEALQAELDTIRNRINELREQLQKQQQELEALHSTQQEARGRLVSLEALQKAALGKEGGTVNAWLESRGLHEAPRLAEQLQVEPGWERAVETVLGAYLEAVCVEDLNQPARALDELGEGSLSLFDIRAVAGAGPAGDRALAAKVSAPWSLQGLMDGVQAVDSLTEALALRPQLGPEQSVITRDGIWLGPRWLRLSRDQDAQAGVLEREKEISELSESIDVNAEEIERQQSALQQARDELHSLEQQRDELQTGVNQAHRTHSDLRAQLSAKRSRQEQIHNRREALDKEAGEIRTQQQTDTETHATARSRLHAAMASMDELARERETREAERNRHREALQAARQQAQTDRDEAHGLAIQVESMRTALKSTRENLERMQGQQAHLRQRREELQQAIAAGEAPLREQEQELERLLTQRGEVEKELQAARRAVEEIEHNLRTREQNRQRREQDSQRLREELGQQRMAWQELKTRSQTLLEQLNETGYELETLKQELSGEASIEAWAEELDKLETRIQRLGPINLAAIEEFEEQSRRKEYLDAQHKDLTEALDTLENAIRKIDRETRTRFKETFDKVNTGLQAMFPRLFGGGHAYLELTGEDLLDTGVAVMARPPGKRNSTIHLLSGGEKALTAVALVFAIFELNPSPFCMLDEVDAPLDDANVGRFCGMVREMAERVQFIFITHNKITMELSNQLIGVTMNEPGVSRLVAVDIDEAAQMAAM